MTITSTTTAAAVSQNHRNDSDERRGSRQVYTRALFFSSTMTLATKDVAWDA